MDKKKITCHSSPILEKELKKIKIEWKKLRELIKNVKTSKIQKKFYKSWGEVAIIDQSKNFIAGYTDNIKCITKESIVFGDHTCSIKFINFPFVQGADGIKILQTKDNLVSLKYIYYSMCNFIKYDGKYRRHWSDISNISIPIPSIKEQTKIANFFTLLDKQIQLIERKLELYELRKKYYLNNIFCDDYSNLPKLRFEGFEDIWKEKKIFDLLKYEQPTKYIVDFAKYNYNKSKIPVLTANKGFILGYTDEINNIYNKGNSIIFDDFTTDFKYVDFKYKIKSSAIKILTTKNDDSLYFIFNLWQKKRFIPIGHNRHYISIIQEIFFSLPSLEEQTKIANLFSSLDESIQNLKKQKDQLTKRKTYYLNNMFV